MEEYVKKSSVVGIIDCHFPIEEYVSKIDDPEIKEYIEFLKSGLELMKRQVMNLKTESINTVHCSDCQYWDDKPVVGDDGQSWARCRKYGWLQANDFYCKDGAVNPVMEGGEKHGLQA